jgi:hypothetical protein
MKTSVKMTLGAVLMTAILLQPAAALAQATAFTYQGRLTDGGQAASGIYDWRFTIYDAAGGGNGIDATTALNCYGTSSGSGAGNHFIRIAPTLCGERENES